MRDNIDRYQEVKNTSVDSALIFLNRASSFAKEMSLDTSLAELGKWKSSIFIQQGNFDSARFYLDQSLDIYNRRGDSLEIHQTYYNFGYYHYYQRQFDSSYYYFLKTLNYYKAHNISEGIGALEMGIGTHHYYYKEDYKKALEYFRQSARSYAGNHLEGEAGALLFAALAHKQLGALDSANYLLMKSLEITEEHGITGKKLQVLSYLGAVQLERNNREGALGNLMDALELAKDLGDKTQEARISASIANLILDTVTVNEGFRSKMERLVAGYGGLDEFLVFVEDYTLQYGIPFTKIQLLKYLSGYHERSGNYRRALHYHQRYAGLRDSIRDRVKSEALAEMEVKYENLLKDKELVQARSDIRILDQKRELDRLYLLVALILFILSVMALWFYVRMSRVRAQKVAKAREAAEIKAEVEERERKIAQLELREREQELTTQAMALVQKNDLIQKIKDQLRETEGSNLAELRVTLNSNQIKEKDWEKFNQSFSKVNPEFYSDLLRLNSRLTNKDLRLCALIRLGLNNREVANILSINLSSVDQAKYRLKKKLNLETEQTLESFLIQLNFNNQ